MLAPEIIDIRQFDARAFTPLLEAESRVWDTRLRWDYKATAQMISSCLDEKRLSGYALVQETRIRGYSFFFYEGTKGVIANLFVEPGGAGLDHALLLLDHVFETLIGTPGLSRVEAQLPHFTLEELEPSFRARGFVGYLRRFMAASLIDRPPRSAHSGAARFPIGQGRAPLSDDCLIELWERKHDREAAQLLYSTYQGHVDTSIEASQVLYSSHGGHVDAVINDQYASVAGAARLIENIVHHRGCGELLPRASLVAIHRPTRKLAGILALTAVRPGTAHIPQVAVAREFQGTGLGTSLMESSFQELARENYREVSLTVTDINAGAVRLYERLGFVTLRTFGAFVWHRP